jgi:hypothetical protein
METIAIILLAIMGALGLLLALVHFFPKAG